MPAPFGNLQYNPDQRKYPKRENYDKFIEKLLADILYAELSPFSSATTEILSAKNRSLANFPSKTFLLTFHGLDNDPKWTNTWNMESQMRPYIFYLTIRTSTSAYQLKQGLNTLKECFCNNWNTNGTPTLPSQYSVVIDNQTYSSWLNKNQLLEEMITTEGEDPEQPNFITGILRVNFGITYS